MRVVTSIAILIMLFCTGCAPEQFTNSRQSKQTLLAGTPNAIVRVGYPTFTTHAILHPPESFSLVTMTGQRIPIVDIRHDPSASGYIGTLTRPVPGEPGAAQVIESSTPSGEGDILTDLEIVDTYRVLLTFDDGPAIGGDAHDGDPADSPTLNVLEKLAAFRHGPNRSKQGITALFFVLTTKDKFIFNHYFKADCADGKALLAATNQYGHILGCHWGGKYNSQMKYHTGRVQHAAYDVTGDGVADGSNALESDLLECIATVEKYGHQRPRYVRPPIWRFEDKRNPAIGKAVADTYARLGLTMILTDAKYPDGGYAYYTKMRPGKMLTFRRYLRNAINSGEIDLVISMHDSNRDTAGKLDKILETIREVFAEQGIDPDTQLDFVDSPEEANALLQRKHTYVMFPRYAR